MNCCPYFYNPILLLCYLSLLSITVSDEIVRTSDNFQLQNIERCNCLLFYHLKMLLHALSFKMQPTTLGAKRDYHCYFTKKEI